MSSFGTDDLDGWMNRMDKIRDELMNRMIRFANGWMDDWDDKYGMNKTRDKWMIRMNPFGIGMKGY